MSIINYLTSLLPVFGRDRILEDLRLARTELLESHSAIKEIAKQLSGPFKSKEAQEVQRVFTNLQTGARSSENAIVYLARITPTLVENIELLERLVKTEFSDTVATQGMDLRQLNMVQVSDAMNFISRYSRYLANYIVRKEFETVATAKKVEFESDEIPFEVEYIQKGIVPFGTALRYLAKDSKEMLEAFATIPEMTAKDVNYKELSRTIGERKLEPFPLSLNNFSWSPFYIRRMSIAEARDARYRECKAQVTAMQTQLLRLQQAAAGRANTGLERDIGYLTKMIASHAKEMEDLSR